MISWFQTDYPEFVYQYREQTRKAPPRKTPVDALRLIALDTETSGFNIDIDRLLSIAVIELVQGQIILDRCWSWIVFQSDITTTKATEIHGILPSEIKQGEPEEAVLRAILPLLSGAIVIGHNIRFDALILDEAMRRNFKVRFCNRLIDVGAMAMTELDSFKRIGYSKQRSPSIEDLCAHLGLPMVDRHTAEGDAFIAAEIFLLLCGRMRRRMGRPLRLADLQIIRL